MADALVKKVLEIDRGARVFDKTLAWVLSRLIDDTIPTLEDPFILDTKL